jgi:hypothetical protein
MIPSEFDTHWYNAIRADYNFPMGYWIYNQRQKGLKKEFRNTDWRYVQ